MKILPVVVLYKKKIEECESLFSLIKMNGVLTYVDTIYIHDNSANENQPIKKYGTFKISTVFFYKLALFSLTFEANANIIYV